MDETLTEVRPERAFDNMLDLSRIEHIFFIGSSLRLPDGTFLSSRTIREAYNLAEANNSKKGKRPAEDANLLKPLGLIDGRSNKKEIKEAREKKGTLDTAFLNCFEFLREFSEGVYSFSYALSAPDENGSIPNQFELKVKKAIPKGWSHKDRKDLDFFRKIKLAPILASDDTNEKPLFNLVKDEESGILTLTYLPLQKSIKP